MELINIPTEQSTAVTDVILSLLSFVAAAWACRYRQNDSFKIALWMAIFSLLGIAALLGALIHGLVLSDTASYWLEGGLSLMLGWLVAIFVVAVVYDLRGPIFAQKLLPWMLVVGFVFFVSRLVWPGSFLAFIIYQSVAMVFALGGYIKFAFDRGPGATWLTLGVLTSLFAAMVQGTQALSFTFLWPFDHNGVYHLIQMLSVILFGTGIHFSMVNN